MCFITIAIFLCRKLKLSVYAIIKEMVSEKLTFATRKIYDCTGRDYNEPTDSIKPILAANGKPIKDVKGLIEFSR